MQSNDPQLNFSNDHQRGYQREQEYPKATATTSEKMEGFSTDMMIENLLKKSFKKLPEMTVKLDHSYAELPLWLQCNSAAVPAQYKYLWSLVQSTVDLADTQKVSQLLLTSGLPVDMLGFIWSLANKAIPGQLTKQEFYIVLALVSLVQSGYTFNNLNILKILTVPSTPVLQIGLMSFPVPQSNSFQKAKPAGFNSLIKASEFPPIQPKPSLDLNEDRDSFINSEINDKISLNNNMENVISQKENIEANFAVITASSKTPKLLLTEHTKNFHKNSNFPCIGLSPTAELEDDFSAFQSTSAEKDNACKTVNQSIHDSCDEFSEFQSANLEHVDPFETVVINQKREIPKIPLPKTLTGKFTSMKSNILKISPESGKKLKVLSAAESLSSLPESKISSSNKVSTCIPVLGSNHGIGSRLANHSLCSQFDVPQGTINRHKHHQIKINPSSPPSEIILGVKTKNLETVIPKCCPKSSKAYRTFVLKETKIRDDDAITESLKNELGNELDLSGVHSGEKTRQIEIPMLGTFNETVLPTQSKPQIFSVDLISVQEDKYSALREIELELGREKNSDVKEVNDDFGDFLSADVSAIATSEAFQSSTEIPNSNSDLPFFQNDGKGSWGDWSSNAELSLNSSNTSSAETLPINEFVGIGNVLSFNTETDLFGPFNLLTFDNVKETSPSNSFLLNQQDCFVEDSKSVNADDSFIVMEKSEKLNNLSSQLKNDQMSINELDNEFRGFVSSESKSPTENKSSGYDSPAQLDFNASPTDKSEQEIIWKKCIDSCHSLIQKGFDIFNNVVRKSVLDEVFAAPETENYLNNLNIVCQISKRVSKNFNGFSSAQDELEKLWGRLRELCFEYNIKLKPDEDNFSDGKYQCGICLMFVGTEVVNEGNNSYHPSCANLWINYIEGVLPSLG